MRNTESSPSSPTAASVELENATSQSQIGIASQETDSSRMGVIMREKSVMGVVMI